MPIQNFRKREEKIERIATIIQISSLLIGVIVSLLLWFFYATGLVYAK